LTPDSELLTTALRAAEAAAAVHRRYAGTIREDGIERKGRADFVSKVDLEAQRAAVAVIRARHPGHGILSEEEDGETGPSTLSRPRSDGPVWIVDPLDGTTNFLHDHPAYAASVGVWIGDEPVAGAVVAPATEERWWGVRGGGAFRNGVPIRTSRLRDLSTALVGTGFPFKFPEQLPRYLGEFSRVLLGTAGIRRGGAASLDLCYLAQGSFDAFWEGTLAPWDIAAGVVIVREAGGIVSRRDGTPLTAAESGSIVAANSPSMHEDLRALLGAD
jgi:myo-inositol-1(or 4)-monophosphatase